MKNTVRKVFPLIPMVGFKKANSLNDFLVRAKLPKREETKGGSNSCGGKRCGVCQYNY